MGGRTKKLAAWCEFEFGKIADAPGNCASCVAHYKSFADNRREIGFHEAKRAYEKTGIVLPQIEYTTATPCKTCPKFNLYPDWHNERGLHPENELAVRIYRFAKQDQRIGVFDCAPLIHSMTIEAICLIVDKCFDEYMPTWLARENMVYKIVLIEREATKIRDADESARREVQRAMQNAKEGGSQEI